jgi:hypothetical protein
MLVYAGGSVINRRDVFALLLAGGGCGLTKTVVAQEARWRNMSPETVAGRELHMYHGPILRYYRGGKFWRQRRNGFVETGTWRVGDRRSSNGHTQSIEVTLDDGDSITFWYFQDGNQILQVWQDEFNGREMRSPVLRFRPI